MPFVPGALIATAALNVPGFVSKPGFTVTCRLTGKLPAVGLTLSHVVPPSVIGVAVKFVTLELELERITVCDIAAVLPSVTTKLSELGLAEIALGAPVESAFSVTGMDRVVVPDNTLIKPALTPEVGAPDPIETVRTAGVALLDEATISQPVPEYAVTEMFAVPLADESSTVCDGVVTPVWVLNVSCCGVATTAFVCASAVSK